MSHENNKELIQALNECAAECNRCMAACLDESDVKMLTRCIKLEIDCAEICRLAISFVARGSEHAEHILKECAELCEQCATECEMHKHMDHCSHCALVCRKCAEECLATNHENVVA